MVGESTDQSIWILLPAYNEAQRIEHTLSQLCVHSWEVVLVDDGSTDTTGVVAQKHKVWLIRHVVNCGQGAALQTALDFALQHDAQVLVTFDADGQHSVDDIRSLVAPIIQGDVDVVLGSRFLGNTEGMPWSRWIMLKLAVLFTRVFSRIQVTDAHNGLRAFSRHAASQICLTQDRMAHASEILDQIRAAGLHYCEVPVTVRYTAATLQKGQTSWQALKIVSQLILGRLIR